MVESLMTDIFPTIINLLNSQIINWLKRTQNKTAPLKKEQGKAEQPSSGH